MVTSLTWFLVAIHYVALPANLELGLEWALLALEVNLMFFLHVVHHFLPFFPHEFTQRTLYSRHHLCQWLFLTLFIGC